jgi:hypothetical protein
MVDAQKMNFQRIYSVELSLDLWKDAVSKFEPYPNVKILHGDSGKVLPSIIEQLEGTAIFWLDGHYSEGVTAKGEKNCPIFEEIDAIFLKEKIEHVILIDDARLFVGENDYPTISELTEYIHEKHSKYKLLVKDDIIRCTLN